jgi:hypothetical protein
VFVSSHFCFVKKAERTAQTMQIIKYTCQLKEENFPARMPKLKTIAIQSSG